MWAAASHISIISPSIRAQERFRDVDLAPGTGNGGCLMIFGWVGSRSDLDALRSAVERSKPPVSTIYNVSILPPDGTPD